MAARDAANTADGANTKDGDGINNSVAGLSASTTEAQLEAFSLRRQVKEFITVLGTEKEKTVVVVNMAKARGVARSRFLAVGIFLSILAVCSNTLIDNMRKLWRICGHLDMNQLQDRRVRLPVCQALQRWITLEDEITDEEVIISVAYERLQNSCLLCGMIGHHTPECKPLPVPALEQCLGAEKLCKLFEEENLPPAMRKVEHHQAIVDSQEGEGSDSFVQITGQIQDHAASDTEERKKTDHHRIGATEQEGKFEGRDERTDKEAGSPGAAGNLTSAEDRAGQEQ